MDDEEEIGGEVSKHHWKNPEYLSISLIIKNHKIVCSVNFPTKRNMIINN